MIEQFTQQLAAAGLNLIGRVSIDAARGHIRRPDRVRPDVLAASDAAGGSSASLLLCGSGGRAHWESIPTAERGRPHPVEDHARRVIAAAVPLLPPPSRLLDVDETLEFDLRRIGALAGWGYLSPYLQVLIHPTYGPWISMRALVLTAAPGPASSPAGADYDPCTACPRPCLEACPVGAYAPGRSFEFSTCAAHRLHPTRGRRHCEDACHARAACVVGREHAYGEAEYRHRHRANLPSLRAWDRS